MDVLKHAKKMFAAIAAAAVFLSPVCGFADNDSEPVSDYISPLSDSFDLPDAVREDTVPLKNTGYSGEPEQIIALGSYMDLCVGQSGRSVFEADLSRMILLCFEEGYLTLRHAEKYTTGLTFEGLDTSAETDNGVVQASYYYGSEKFELSIPYSVRQWRLTLKGGKRDVVLTPDSELKVDLRSYYESFKRIEGFIGWRVSGSDDIYTTECVMTSPDMTLEPVIAGKTAAQGEGEGEYVLNEYESYYLPLFTEIYEDCRVLTIGKDVFYIDTKGFTDIFPNLEEIRVEEGNELYSVENDILCREDTAVMIPAAASEIVIPADISKVWIEAIHGIKAERIVFLSETAPEISGVCDHDIDESALIVVPDSENDAVFCRYLADFTYVSAINKSRIITDGHAEERNFFDGNAVYERKGDDIILKYVSSKAEKLFRPREDTTVIAPDCFSDCHAVSSVMFGAKVRQIEGSCFDNLYELCALGFKSEIPPAGIDKLKQETVAGAKLLIPSDDNIYDNYVDVLGDAFGGNVKERFIRMTPDYKIDDDGVITSSDALISVPAAFYGVLTLGPEITKIAPYAAKYCDSLRAVVTEGSDITEIGKSAFEHCNSLMRFGSAEGDNYVNLARQTNLVDLGENIFAECPYINSVSFPSGLEKVSVGAFRGCVQLKKVSAWGGVSTIDREAFRNTGFYAFDLRNSEISCIESDALADCKNLGTLLVNAALDKLDSNFTNEGARLLTVCASTKAAPLSRTDFAALISSARLYSKIFTNKNNDADVSLLPGIETELYEGSYFVPENRSGVYTSKLNENGIRCYKFVKADIKAVNYRMIQLGLNNTTAYVTEIAPGAFKDCAELETVAINRTVREIPAHEFEGLSKLSSMEIISSAILPGSTAQPKLNIGEYAFKDCTALVDPGMNILSGTVGKGAFEGCTSLKNIYWDCDSSEIPDDAFKGCSSLTTFNIGTNSRANIRRIGNHAFSGCSMLKRIMGINYSVMFANIEEIGDYAFEDCMRLSDIWLPYPVKRIGKSAFEGCESLMNVRVYVSASSPMIEIGETVFGDDPSDAVCFDIWTYDKSVYQAYMDKWRDQLDSEYGDGAAKALVICSRRMDIPDEGDIIEIDIDDSSSVVCWKSLARTVSPAQITNLCWRKAVPGTRIYLAAKASDGKLLALNQAEVCEQDIGPDNEADLSHLNIPVSYDAEYCDVYFWDSDMDEMVPKIHKKSISADKIIW